MKLLLIEDNTVTVESIKLCLEIYQPKLTIMSTGSGLEGIRLAKNDEFDVVILDLGLSDTNGIKVLEEIRCFSNLPIVVISARHTPEIIDAALEAGADDYILKPFDYNHFLSRVTCVVERSISGGHENQKKRFAIDDLVILIDFNNADVTLDGNQIELTSIEWDVLSKLAWNEGRIVTVRALAKEVWKSETVDMPSIETIISQLRAKLGDDPYKPKIIIPVYKSGYRFLGSA